MLHITWDSPRGHSRFAHPTVTVSGCPFHNITLAFAIPDWGPSTPEKQVPLVWALPISLAATHGIISFSFPGGTEMFHFPPCCFYRLYIHLQMTAFKGQTGSPIRKSAGQSLLAANHGLSQLATSFIASWHQGIHQLHLVA